MGHIVLEKSDRTFEQVEKSRSELSRIFHKAFGFGRLFCPASAFSALTVLDV